MSKLFTVFSYDHDGNLKEKRETKESTEVDCWRKKFEKEMIEAGFEPTWTPVIGGSIVDSEDETSMSMVVKISE